MAGVAWDAAERTADMVIKSGALEMWRTLDFIPDKSIAAGLWERGRTYEHAGGFSYPGRGNWVFMGVSSVRASDRRSRQISIR